MEIISRFLALTLIVILSPILIFISILCIIFQGFPIIFKQERVGYNYKIFKIYKFRTMSRNNGDLITIRHDRRITKIGKILRMTKIDEIPQLLNILKGDMRFIGPRPEVPSYFEKSAFHFLMNVNQAYQTMLQFYLEMRKKYLKE